MTKSEYPVAYECREHFLDFGLDLWNVCSQFHSRFVAATGYFADVIWHVTGFKNTTVTLHGEHGTWIAI